MPRAEHVAPEPSRLPVGTSVRVADVLAGLTTVNDLAMGHPAEEALRAALVATAFARSLDLSEPTVAEVYYTALLEHVGCTAFAHETAAMLGGDDRAVHAAGARTNFADHKDPFVTFLPELTRGAGVLRRVRIVGAAMVNGPRVSAGQAQANCEVAAQVAARLGLAEGVQAALGQSFEWWNGRGGPAGVGGDDLAVATRVTHVASTAVLFHRLGGERMALDALRQRSGGYLDPEMVERFVRIGPRLLNEATSVDPTEAVLDAEPAPLCRLSPADLQEAARAFGELVDLKSPYLQGHSTAVAALAHEAGETLHLDEARDGRLRLAGHLQDVGRAGVASGIWDKPGALTVAEREQVELHSYYSERIVSRSAALEPVAALVGMHHERSDGSGYHRRYTSERIPMAARVLAAADVFVALTRDRPHRAAFAPGAAAAALIRESEVGRLDPEAVTAVLAAAGERPRPVRREWPAGLTDRQVDVLRLVARGYSNRQVAQELVLSTRTAERHVQDIYAKLGSSSRAAAAMFAMRHSLLE